ncbi:serine/threonine protein kinase [Vibrio sp. MACH09]|uniref:diguanylate cyclase n=1 Tax=Vibrio sp. MACH09 TaxID=3025122 RepID=UPI0027924954|nr:diguanylate cyclase [Vibrio sp. MACH09]GLO61083.1 serine/threonine protein kinase [Vibrio sp. MACH09]
MTEEVVNHVSKVSFYRENFLLFEPCANSDELWCRSWSKQTETFQISLAKRNEILCLNQLAGKGAPKLSSQQDADASLHLLLSHPRQLSQINLAKLSIQQKITIAKSLISALADVHANNVFHFSIRPSVFLLSDDFTSAVMVDFSSGRICPKGSTGISAFYPYNADARFLAPEQNYLLDRPIDNRVDLYSLGCVLVWLFTEQLPYNELLNEEEIGYAHISKKLHFEHRLIGLDDSEHKDNIIQLVNGLINKEPSQRYQSAAGVLKDIVATIEMPLQRLDEKENSRSLSDRLILPDRLYGREAEIEILLSAFDRVTNGRSEAILVAGYSGIGKSALVNAIKSPIIDSDGLYLTGKFDQYQRDMPYRAIQQALTQLVKQLLSMPEASVNDWRDKINTALYPNGQVVIDIVPELALLLGPQPELSQLGSEEQQNRFNRVFLDFIHVICSAYRPLVFFIDDLQWADTASIQLIRLLITDVKSRHCLILGAYRDNEVDERHPFSQMLLGIEQADIELQKITLSPLANSIVTEICADTLQRPVSDVTRLSALIYQKTRGNPFFFRQFIQELYQQDLLSFDYQAQKWRWSTEQIKLQNITDNVVDLMTEKLKRLPNATKEIIEKAACVGSSVALDIVIELTEGKSVQETIALLQPALNAGLMTSLRTKIASGSETINAVRFLHDRVQQAAYSQLNDSDKKAIHYQVGNLMLDRMLASSSDKDEHCFEVVSHLNYVHELLDSEQKQQLIYLNLLAARRSKASNAYSTSVNFFNQLFKMLALDSKSAGEIGNSAAIEKLECLYLSGRYKEAEKYRVELESVALSDEEDVQLQVILITQYTRYGELTRAIEQGIKALDNINCSISDDADALQQAISGAINSLATTPFDALLKKHSVEDKSVLLTLDILMAMQPCCYNSGSLLFPMTILKLLELTQQHGNSAYSSYIYTMYGLLCTKVLKDYDTAFEATRCSQEISKQYPKNPMVEGRLSMMRSNFIMPWQLPLQKSGELRETAFQQCFEQGDYYWGVHAYIFGFYADLICAPSLDMMVTRVEKVIDICKEIKQPAQVFLSTLQRNFLQILEGKLDNTKNLSHESGFEDKAISFYQQTNYMCGKYDRLLGRLLQGYLFANYQQTLAVTLAEELGPDDLDEGIFHEAVYTQFNILSILALKQSNPSAVTPHYESWLQQAWQKYKQWYQLNPDNFSAGYYLISAEFYATHGDELNAFNAYEKSISASANAGFALYQAIANERAGLFRKKIEQEAIGNAYLEQAKLLYNKWGAYSKSIEIDRVFITGDYKPATSSVQYLDWQSVISACQDISQPLLLLDLINRILIKTASMTGAQHVCFYQIEEGAWQQKASCHHGKIDKTVAPESAVPESILFYTLNSRKILVIKDAQNDHQHVRDRYVVDKGVRSVLSLPLFVHSNLIGVLYLEHTETVNLFTAQRVQIMELLAGQFAISYQNSQYFKQLSKQNEELEEAVEQRTSELNQKNKHLEIILQTLPVPFGITTVEGRLVQGNEHLLECLELSEAQSKQVNASQFYVDQDDRKRLFSQLDIDGGVTDFECEMKTYHGKPFWATLSVTKIELDFGVGLFVTISDISDRKEKEKRLKHQAFTDPLTGAQNRRAFKRNANNLRIVEANTSLSVAMLDLDNFKGLNDTFGHTAGDIVLRQFTEYVQSHLRDKDILGRLGGEEFGLVLSHIQPKEAVKVVQRIVELVEKMTVLAEQHQIQFTVSIGLTRWKRSESLQESLNRADSLLYQAKQQGRNQVQTDIK